MGFKKDFLWGGAVSAAQIEGAWNEDGKSPTYRDYLLGGNSSTRRSAYYKDQNGEIKKVYVEANTYTRLPEGCKYIISDDPKDFYPNHKACDFYHRYKEDLDLLVEMGANTFNVTVSWARVLPHGIQGGVNQKGVEFYREFFKECKKRHIEPIVTLYKYDMPCFYEEEWGGWSNPALIDEFVAFSKICFEEYQDLVKYWITINEINIIKQDMDVEGDVTPQKARVRFDEIHNMMLAAAKATSLAHSINENYKVGCMIAATFTYPLTCDPLDALNNQKLLQGNFYMCADVMARGSYPYYTKSVFDSYGIEFNVSEEDEKILLDGKADFFAFSYYSTNTTTTHAELLEDNGAMGVLGCKNPYLNATDWGWQIDPVGLHYWMHEIYSRYQMPLFLIENGMGAIDKLEDGKVHDPYRIAYHKAHIEKMRDAVNEGVDLFGYTSWSGIDIVSNSTGEFRKRYGFIYVDTDDQGNGTYNRYKKDSFYWYKKVIASNGEDLEIE